MLAILLGQVLSLCIASTGVFSTLLVNEGISLPAAQSLLNYLALALVYGGWLIWKRQELKAAAYKFALLGFIDVVANFCLIQAYSYTSLTSVTLLDCWSVPSVLFLSWYFLGVKYRLGHLVGAVTCIAAIVLLIVTDEEYRGEAKANNILLGDALVLFGSTLYAVSNILQEKLLVDVGKSEVLAMLGLFGAVWCSVLAAALEGRTILELHWDAKVALPFLGFSLALFSFSSIVPYVLLLGGATILNISLLTSDVWAAAARQLVFGGFTTASALSFTAAFALVSIGICIFSLSKTDAEESPEHIDEDTTNLLSDTDQGSKSRDQSMVYQDLGNDVILPGDDPNVPQNLLGRKLKESSVELEQL